MEKKPVNLSAERNKGPIIEIIENLNPEPKKILELASGTGQHGHYYCKRQPHVLWQLSDYQDEALAASQIWRDDLSQDNLLAPKKIDCLDHQTWPQKDSYDLLVNINMIHISPWETTQGLFRCAAHCLKPRGRIYLYGPYFHKDREASSGNIEFDQWLRSKDSTWGIRFFEDVCDLAEANGFALQSSHPMPANNTSLIFEGK
ncbi:DUF938 domain-containing protein [Pseudobacteriovorax antillogorgiicola]|uniref:SAM-dependent methyltransferase n=1 Tax=Pseudobacteriovorax antillogorgiicola TaxID=1513793 RepID=A0A1Y6BVI6_9BACT|nr:DUF938 domain-containing protein [Pseudobacteriovorax antillogorgiicola]TCS53783.1 uncharacterized protein DUF938 [Pseudobacteriovorax antillogorgiicola]SMF22298.1 Protein of unknown function [Pseudobacteriovorax antillogorgiicola]